MIARKDAACASAAPGKLRALPPPRCPAYNQQHERSIRGELWIHLWRSGSPCATLFAPNPESAAPSALVASHTSCRSRSSTCATLNSSNSCLQFIAPHLECTIRTALVSKISGPATAESVRS
ncbi:hypothetical protein BFW01_g10995 [Lasiodiplodia theobromae]|uniref:Uncharacterized protein n=1 Tax=Lasiodiplodia theobromae TaxID=45133 RepID=A0A8H7IR52_9PEZI|nr:hypothetical protein BFW01_g10995 [Lasiodiplodia theobromae]